MCPAHDIESDIAGEKALQAFLADAVPSEQIRKPRPRPIFSWHQCGAKRENRKFLNNPFIEKRAKPALPARRISHPDKIVRTEFVLIWISGCDVGCNFELQHDALVGVAAELYLAVADRIALFVRVGVARVSLMRRMPVLGQKVE